MRLVSGNDTSPRTRGAWGSFTEIALPWCKLLPDDPRFVLDDLRKNQSFFGRGEGSGWGASKSKKVEQTNFKQQRSTCICITEPMIWFLLLHTKLICRPFPLQRLRSCPLWLTICLVDWRRSFEGSRSNKHVLDNRHMLVQRLIPQWRLNVRLER